MGRCLLLVVMTLASLMVTAQQPTLKQAYDGCFLVGAALNSDQFTGKDAKEAAITEKLRESGTEISEPRSARGFKCAVIRVRITNILGKGRARSTGARPLHQH